MTVKELTTPAEFASADRLQRLVWGIDSGSTPVPAEVLNAISHSGGYVAGAFSGGRLVGVVSGLIGWHAQARRVFVWDQIHAAEHRGAGIGSALMADQKSWCLARGIDSIRWTFDPLVSRNAYFGLTKLGAEVLSYLPDFYGRLDDSVNLGDESDRLLVTWSLGRDRRRDRDSDADSGPGRHRDPGYWRPLLAVDGRGRPTVLPRSNAIRMACPVPPDIEDLRRRDPALAAVWRRTLRERLLEVMEEGGRIVGFTRHGHYLLTAGGTRA